MCNCVQERMGLRNGQISKQLDRGSRVYPSSHVHCGLEPRIHVAGCGPSVFLWEEAPGVVSQQLGTQCVLNLQESRHRMWCVADSRTGPALLVFVFVYDRRLGVILSL
jgi:hypothetical protein